MGKLNKMKIFLRKDLICNDLTITLLKEIIHNQQDRMENSIHTKMIEIPYLAKPQIDSNLKKTEELHHE